MEQQNAIESNCLLSNSKISVLINNLAKMSKNPTIESDLSQVLDDFLLKVSESDNYLENGIVNMNFAEAALVVQSSTNIYSKKVDLLWDIIFDYQKRMITEENGDKDQEIEKIEERKRKYKRKRKTKLVEAETSSLVNNFSFGSGEKTDYLNQDYDVTNLVGGWEKFTNKQLNNNSLEQTISKNTVFLPVNSIHTEDYDYVGRYDQFHSASLIAEIFYLEEQKLLADEHNCVAKMRIDTCLINDFLLENKIPTNKPLENYSKQLKQYLRQFEKSTEENFLHLNESFVYLGKNSLNVVNELRRISLADSLFEEDIMSSISGDCPTPCETNPELECRNDIDQTNRNLGNRSKSCSGDSAFYEDDHGICDVSTLTDASNSVAANDANTSASTSNAENADSTNQDENFSSADDVENEGSTDATESSGSGDDPEYFVSTDDTDLSGSTDDDGVTLVTADSDDRTLVSPRTDDASAVKPLEKSASEEELSPITNKQLCLGSSSIVTRSKMLKRRYTVDNVQEKEESLKRRKLQKQKYLMQKKLEKLATGKTVNYRQFEKFFRQQYKPSEGEGGSLQDMSDSEEENADDEEVSDEEQSEDSFSSSNEEYEPYSEEQQMPVLEETNDVDPSLLPPLSPIPESHLPTNLAPPTYRSSTSFEFTTLSQTLLPSSCDLEEEEISRRNVREWRYLIIPKIKNMKSKSDFDIHEYGSRIIEPFEVGEETHFKYIVQRKSAAEVTRFFMATLQLANSSNIEITGNLPGQLSNDSFKVKVLDKTRHHETLEDYQAPSEETFRERLERAKAMNPNVRLHSTPQKSSKYTPSKRKKYF